MATETLAPSLARQPMWRRLLLLVALVLLLAVVGVCGWFYSWAHSALPQLDGELTVKGLAAPVMVTRDSHGVPTIEAVTLEDLFFAQGYVTAQDRLFQMDAMRRYAAGELSEILGGQYVKHDREQRILGLRVVAQKALESTSTRDRVFFEAYTRGVNVYIESHRDRLPIEFRILGYTPLPWTAEDSVLMGANMVQNLNHGYFQRALEKEKILAKLGPDLTADLYVNSSWHDHPPEKGPVSFDQPDEKNEGDDADEGGEVTQIEHRRVGMTAVADDPFAQLRPGSNNWVVSGAHTVTGKPMLSNDMHLDHQMPNLWFEAHLHCRDYDVAGVTLPGVPFVIVGHNQRIGWGFTNVGPLVEDLYVETFNAQGQYSTPKGWLQPEHRGEVIHVKGGADVVMDVVSTRHGPVISELIPGEQRKIVLRWTLYNGMHDPFFDVDSAQNWDQFVKALSSWDSPAQNAMYADVEGHIGYHATGQIPIRAAGDGSLPVSGADDSHEWTGYIPFDKLPNIHDPSWGVLASANGRITPDGYPYSIATEWDAPWRSERIYHVLQSGRKLASSDMLSLQTDIYSAFDRFCAERFVYALDRAKNVSPKAVQARELMRDWDGRLAADSAAATVETLSRRELTRLFLEPMLGPAPESGDHAALSWKDYRWSMGSVWMENVLLKQPKRWLPEKYTNYDAVLAAAVEAAVNGKDAPSHLSDWNWGKTYPLFIQNPVLRSLPLVSRWTGPGLHEQSGGGYTVKQVGRSFGPSERMTIDFSNFDQTTLNLVTGQGGNFLSPYYMDQWKAWYEGFTFQLPYSKDAVQRTQSHKVVLQPG